jgi:hypothetical protein
LQKGTLSAKLPISPQVGEMPNFGKEGRTEGGREGSLQSAFILSRSIMDGN